MWISAVPDDRDIKRIELDYWSNNESAKNFMKRTDLKHIESLFLKNFNNEVHLVYM